MPGSNEKTNNFLEAINQYAEEQRNKIQAEVELFKQQELEKAETESLTDAYHLIQKEMADMRLAISSEVSRKSMESRRQLLAKRQSIMDTIFQKAAQRLIDYTKTEQYPALLESYAKKLAGVLNAPGSVLYVCATDMQYEELIKKSFGRECTIRAAGDIRLGGIRGANAAMGLVADETLDSKLDEQREWFTENCGMAV
jgi:V/A-type H+-transporting ATPase subunit E